MDDATNTAEMRISELGDCAGVSAKTIRYYEQVGLLPDPARTAAGHRIYGRADAERVGFIKGARRLGFPLGEIAEILALRDRGRAPCDYVCELLARRHADVDRAIAQLTELKRDLAALQRRAEHLPRPPAGDGYCHILQADHSS